MRTGIKHCEPVSTQKYMAEPALGISGKRDELNIYSSSTFSVIQETVKR